MDYAIQREYREETAQIGSILSLDTHYLMICTTACGAPGSSMKGLRYCTGWYSLVILLLIVESWNVDATHQRGCH